MLNDENIDLLLNRFPNVKLCYEKMIHNKVDSDFYVANPYGKKVFISVCGFYGTIPNI